MFEWLARWTHNLPVSALRSLAGFVLGCSAFKSLATLLIYNIYKRPTELPPAIWVLSPVMLYLNYLFLVI